VKAVVDMLGPLLEKIHEVGSPGSRSTGSRSVRSLWSRGRSTTLGSMSSIGTPSVWQELYGERSCQHQNDEQREEDEFYLGVELHGIDP